MADDRQGVQSTSATGSTEEAMALMREVGMTPMAGYVAVGKREWIVTIYERRKRPAVTCWLGWPVRYSIGKGAPCGY